MKASPAKNLVITNIASILAVFAIAGLIVGLWQPESPEAFRTRVFKFVRENKLEVDETIRIRGGIVPLKDGRSLDCRKRCQIVEAPK